LLENINLEKIKNYKNDSIKKIIKNIYGDKKNTISLKWK
jgi:hypothetical protein